MAEKYIRTSLLFEHLVDDPGWMPYFLDFLSRHDQSHLLLFWLEVEVFELAAGGGPSLVTQASRIFEYYLSPESPKHIQIPADMLAFIQAELATLAPNINVFAAAHAFVFRRLRQTWYPAFLLSSTYQSLLEHLKKSFNTPLKEILVDEVQSRYLEAFLLNDSTLPPASVGNIYLWKKIHNDLRPLGTRLARDRTGDRNGEDIRLFITDAKATYESYIQPSPQTGIPGGPPVSVRGPSRGSAASATALNSELRHRIAECLGRLVSQSKYYAGVGSIVAVDRNLLTELSNHFADTQRAILAWLESEVFPSFQRSWLCGVLSGDIQSRRSAPLRRKRRLWILFRSVRSFRHVYVPPCPRSEGRGLVLVSTEGVSPSPPEPLDHEFVWGFDVVVNPVEGGGGKGRSSGGAAHLNDEDEEEEEGGEDGFRFRGLIGGGGSTAGLGVGSHQGEVGGAIVPSNDGLKGYRHTVKFRSTVRSSQVMATGLLPSSRKGGAAATGAAASSSEETADSSSPAAGAATSELCAALEDRVAREVQRLTLPSLCLMPLERSTFVLFSPKLVVPEPTLHHFVLPIARKDVEPVPLSHAAPETPFMTSPRSNVLSLTGEQVEPPDLSPEDHFYLYGACLMEWLPGGDEVLLPRCLTLVSTEPRIESLRAALVAIREAQGIPGVAGTPVGPATPKIPSSNDPISMKLTPSLLDRRPMTQSFYSLDTPRPWLIHSSSSNSLTSPTTAFQVPSPSPSPSPTQSLLLSVPPLDASLLPLFQTLSPETLLKALTAVILERPIIVQSSSKSLMVLVAEGLRRLLFPFGWLRPYRPLLPVASICGFWDDIRKVAGGRTWFDYFFEEDGLDDSLVPGAGEGYVEPISASSARLIPGYLIGLESCIIESATRATKTLSPAYKDATCHAWACSTCEIHSDGWSGEAPLSSVGQGSFDFESPFSPARGSAAGGPLSARSPSVQNRGGTGGIDSTRANSTTKYGELPSCVRQSARELISCSFIIDLDKDQVIGPRRGEAVTSSPPLPEAAASTLLTALQRAVNPTLQDGLNHVGYGYRAVCAAREGGPAAVSLKRDSQKIKKNKKEEKQQKAAAAGEGGGEGGGEGTEGTSTKVAGTGNAILHDAFISFFRTIILDRYREFTLSFLEEQMVAFHADSFLASQPEPTHGFWIDFFQTRLFAHFLLLEHQRIASTFSEPEPLPLPSSVTPFPPPTSPIRRGGASMSPRHRPSFESLSSSPR